MFLWKVKLEGDILKHAKSCLYEIISARRGKTYHGDIQSTLSKGRGPLWGSEGADQVQGLAKIC